MKTVTTKFGNMRKPQNFVVYPQSDAKPGYITVQSNTVMAVIEVSTGNATFANVPGGAYYAHLALRGEKINVPASIVAEFLLAMPKKGDKVFNSAVVIG